MSQPANISNIATTFAPHTSVRRSMSDEAFAKALAEEYRSPRCLKEPRLAPTEYSGAIRYGSVRSVKFEFPEMKAEAA